MKPSLVHSAVSLGLAAALVASTACSSPVSARQTAKATAKVGVPGGTFTKTTEITATVTGVDKANRKVTLVTSAGEKTTVKAGPDVVNFPQIQVGDQLTISFTQELVVRMAQPGENIKDDGAALLILNPVGAKPGAGVAASAQLVATVTKLDPKQRKATLQFSDGSSDKFHVRDDIDLSKYEAGDRVVIQVTEAYAAVMTKKTS